MCIKAVCFLISKCFIHTELYFISLNKSLFFSCIIEWSIGLLLFRHALKNKSQKCKLQQWRLHKDVDWNCHSCQSIYKKPGVCLNKTLSIANVYLWFSIVNALEKRDAANNEKTQKWKQLTFRGLCDWSNSKRPRSNIGQLKNSQSI